MKIKLSIPNQDQITLEQYQLIDKCYKDNGDTSFSDKFLIKIIFDLSFEQIDSIKQSKLTEILTELKGSLNADKPFQNRFKMNGVEYGFIPCLQDMTVGEYADLENYISTGDDYHKAMAVMYRPIVKSHSGLYSIEEYKGAKESSELMKSSPFSVLKSALVFFCNLEKDLLGASLNFMIKEMNKIQGESGQRKSKSLIKSGVGLQHLSNSLKGISLESNKLLNSQFIKP